MYLPGATPRPVQTPRPSPAPPAALAPRYIARLASIAGRRPLRCVALRSAPSCVRTLPYITLHHLPDREEPRHLPAPGSAPCRSGTLHRSAPPPGQDQTERDRSATLCRAAPRPDIAPSAERDRAATLRRASGLRRRTLLLHCPDIVKIHYHYNVEIHCSYNVNAM